MKLTRYDYIAATVLLITGGLFFAQWRTLQAKRSDYIALTQLATKRPPATPPERSAPKTEERQPPPPADSLLTEILRASPRAPNGVPTPNLEKLLPHYPSLGEAYVKTVKAERRLAYAQYFASAGLSPAEITRFCDILAAREASWANLVSSGVAESEARARDVAFEQERERKLQELLGKERYQKLADFRRTAEARSELGALVLYGSAPDASFNVQTMDVLTELCAEQRIFSRDKWREAAPNFEKVRVEAAKYLSPEKLALLNLIIDSQEVHYLRATSSNNPRS